MFPVPTVSQSVLTRTCYLACAVLMALCTGCGTTKQHEATQQLMASDAVDTAIARIDFTPLEGQTVYFDTNYIKNYKGVGFVNAEYVISSLRQQMFAAGLKVREAKDEADYIIEGRVGALGENDHEVVYGMPATSSLNAATSAVAATSGIPIVPTIPEISIARRNDQAATAKIGVFAYHRESGERVWQSGLKVARATSKDLWIMGAGPFQRGTIYDDKLRFAGTTLGNSTERERAGRRGIIAAYKDEALFEDLKIAQEELPSTESDIQQASAEEPAAEGEPAAEAEK
ncbi:MAG: hypothetical protein KDA88_21225 [Planctomycetaceae bacterium]|nr:hypothetical protein [Planctomycetaceae bacterium]MCB9951902.1 hypothetical protein [Planctomycetaceae bacterium]